MIYNKVTKHKQAGIYECLHCNKTNTGAWTGNLKHSRYKRRKNKKPLLFSKCQISGEVLKTDYSLRDTLGCFRRQVESVVI